MFRDKQDLSEINVACAGSKIRKNVIVIFAIMLTVTFHADSYGTFNTFQSTNELFPTSHCTVNRSKLYKTPKRVKQRTLLTKMRKKMGARIHSVGAFLLEHKKLFIERNSQLRLEEFYNVERR